MTKLFNFNSARAFAFGKAAAPILMVPAAMMATAAYSADEPPAALAGTGIENIVTATGTYAAAPVVNQAYEQVPVEAGAPDLTVVKTVSSIDISKGDATMADGTDEIVYSYSVTNDGNVTLSGVTPVETGVDGAAAANGITFNGVAGTGALSAYTLDPAVVGNSTTLAPGETAVFLATYTMSATDALLAAGVTDAVDNQVTSAAVLPDGTTAYDDTDSSLVETTLAALPRLDIVKTSALTEINGDTTDGAAAVGDTVVYTYTVQNTGNVAITDVGIADTHEGVAIAAGLIVGDALVTDGPLAALTPAIESTDAAVNGSWDVIQAGATVTFTYTHTVTQAEVDAG